MSVENRTLYVFDTDEGIQIDPASITLHQGEITSVTDTSGVERAGTVIEVKMPNDFIYVPDLDLNITVGDEIYLDRDSHERWTVRQGWYEVDGNPAIYGWYLESIPVGRVRSLYQKDLNSLTAATTLTSLSLPTVTGGGG